MKNADLTRTLVTVPLTGVFFASLVTLSFTTRLQRNTKYTNKAPSFRGGFLSERFHYDMRVRQIIECLPANVNIEITAALIQEGK